MTKELDPTKLHPPRWYEDNSWVSSHWKLRRWGLEGTVPVYTPGGGHAHRHDPYRGVTHGFAHPATGNPLI